jgi:hypothetical protein
VYLIIACGQSVDERLVRPNIGDYRFIKHRIVQPDYGVERFTDFPTLIECLEGRIEVFKGRFLFVVEHVADEIGGSLAVARFCNFIQSPQEVIPGIFWGRWRSDCLGRGGVNRDSRLFLGCNRYFSLHSTVGLN